MDYRSMIQMMSELLASGAPGARAAQIGAGILGKEGTRDEALDAMAASLGMQGTAREWDPAGNMLSVAKMRAKDLNDAMLRDQGTLQVRPVDYQGVARAGMERTPHSPTGNPMEWMALPHYGMTPTRDRRRTAQDVERALDQMGVRHGAARLRARKALLARLAQGG